MKEIYSSWFPCLIGRLWATNAAPSIFCYFQTNWFLFCFLFSISTGKRRCSSRWWLSGMLQLQKIWILSKQMCCQLVLYHFWLPLRLIPELNPNFPSSWLILPPISEHQIFLGVPVPDLRCCKSSQGFFGGAWGVWDVFGAGLSQTPNLGWFESPEQELGWPKSEFMDVSRTRFDL